MKNGVSLLGKLRCTYNTLYTDVHSKKVRRRQMAKMLEFFGVSMEKKLHNTRRYAV